MAVATTIGFFGCATTAVLQWLTKSYIVRLYTTDNDNQLIAETVR
jgi:hypothetical protein